MTEKTRQDEHSGSPDSYVACEDCVHCVILEDRSEDMRRPSAFCTLKIPMKEVDCMEWVPIGGDCPQFLAGEPEYL